MENDTLNRTMLFDFFGDLLTDKQRNCFDLHHNEDLSLHEISNMTGASRQAVHDAIKRAEGSLFKMEEKTGIVAKWLKTRDGLVQAAALARTVAGLSGGDGELAELSQGLLLALERLRDGI